MTEDEMRTAVAAQIAMTFDGVKGGRSVVAAVATLAIALPWAREQALREAAKVANSSARHHSKKHAETEDRQTQQFHLAQMRASEKIALAIEALIPSRPSQDPHQ